MTSNLVWLADHDKDALLALIACQHHTCDDCSFAKYPACEAQGGYSKWLWAEHVDDNSVRDDMNKHVDVDSRKKLEKDAWEFVSGAWCAGRNFELGKTPDSWDSDELIALLDRQAAITANEMRHGNPYVGLVRGKYHEEFENSDYYCGRCGYPVTDHDSYCRECGGAFQGASKQQISKSDAPKSEETAENATTKCDMDNFDDSREKLEADVRQYANPSGGTNNLGAYWEKTMLEFLDRQAAITRREVFTQPDERDEQIAELKSECDLWLKRYEQSHEYAMDVESDCEKLTRELAKSSQDDYWDDCSTCEEVDHLQRENINLANDLGKCMAERDEFKRMYNNESNAYKLIKLAYDNAHARAERVTREREELRKNLGAVLDAAQEIRRIGALYGVD